MGNAFGDVFVVSTVLVGCCLIPALFLRRRPAERPTFEQTEEAMVMGV